MEASNVNVQPDFNIAISEDLIAVREPLPSSVESLSFSALLEPPLQLQTDQKQCGGQLWPAGKVLAQYLLQEQLNAMRGKHMFVCPLSSTFPRINPTSPDWSLELEVVS